MLNKTRFSGLLSLLTLSILATMMLFMFNCKKSDADDTSLQSGDCKINEMQIIFTPNPVNLMPGESTEIEVSIAVSSNCDNYIKKILVEIRNEGIGIPFSHACQTTSVINNQGTCNITVTANSGATQGTLQREYKISVFSDKTSTEPKKTEMKSLDINLIIADFSISALVSTSEVVQGLSSSFSFDINRTNGHERDISLSCGNLPDGINYEFDPNPVTENQSLSTITFTAGPDVPPGSYPIQFIGNDGDNERFFDFELNVIEPYSISVSQENISIPQGDSSTLEISLNKIAGWSESITLTAENELIGQGDNAINASFTPNPVLWNENTSQLKLIVGELVAKGIYPITISGVTTVATKSVELQLTVE